MPVRKTSAHCSISDPDRHIPVYKRLRSMKDSPASLRIQLAITMAIFGTVGLVRRNIPMDSLLLAGIRAFLGAASLYAVIRIKGRKLSVDRIRSRFWLIVLVGIIMGFNWVFLFESFNHTSVATATVCYYMEPVFLILASPFVFHERITLPKLVCVILSFIGMIFVSGVLNASFSGIAELKGVFFGLLAALFYALCVIWNKTITDVPVFDRTLIELLAAGSVLFPLSSIHGDLASLSRMATAAWGWVMLLGLINTGVSYGVYFTVVEHLPLQTVAIYSFLDPVLAICFSYFLFHEPMGKAGLFGTIMIIGSTFISELLTVICPGKTKRK